MGTFTIIEYDGMGVQIGQGVQCAHEPAIAEQNAITTSASSQLSAALNAATRLVLVQTTTIVRYKVGRDNTVTASATKSQRLAADESRYFSIDPGSSNYIAVIDAT
jgi:hypothetical protein